MTTRTRILLPALLTLALAGCDELLSTSPVNEIGEDEAIVDAESATAARAGAYDALQDGSYYGENFLTYSDLITEDVEHSGTLSWYASLDGLNVRSDNDGIVDVWDGIYLALGRANVLIDRLPGVEGLDPATLDTYLGEAHFLRALHLHNAVRLWGDVPMPTSQMTLEEASAISRTPAGEVYGQILADLDRAASLMGASSDTRKATPGAAHGLRSRVLLDLEDWQGVVDAADAVEALGYELASSYPDLFDADGTDTPEDIFRLTFTPQESNSIGFYYRSRSAGGRGEVAPTVTLADAYEAGDERFDWSLTFMDRGGRAYYGSKWPTGAGAEDVHVIRFGEVLLNRAEANARLGRLAEAVADYNRLRERAGLAPHELGVDVVSQQDVLEAIWHERRVELAMEGFRWSDLVRTGRAVETLGLEAYQTLWPIPQAEMDVAPNLVQNPGY